MITRYQYGYWIDKVLGIYDSKARSVFCFGLFDMQYVEAQ